jgi:hypothetical protein
LTPAARAVGRAAKKMSVDFIRGTADPRSERSRVMRTKLLDHLGRALFACLFTSLAVGFGGGSVERSSRRGARAASPPSSATFKGREPSAVNRDRKNRLSLVTVHGSRPYWFTIRA